jgi:hypothetical protein
MRFSRCWKQTLYVLLLCGAGVSDATAAVLTLQWDPSPDRSVAGYTVYVGTEPGRYTTAFNVGDQLWFAFQEADPGQSYYFAVAAYSSDNLFGPLSAEVSARVDGSLVLSNPGDVSSAVGVPATVQLTASASSGGLTYAAAGLPYGVGIDGDTGLISGTPSSEGRYDVTATVSNGLDVGSISFLWTVTNQQSEIPTVSLTMPDSSLQMTTSQSSILLGGVATDDKRVAAVHFANDSGGAGFATGTAQWIAAVPLQLGDNQIRITVIDDDLNYNAIYVSVYRS